MAPTRSGISAKKNPRGINPGMTAGGEGPLSQTSNIIIRFDWVFLNDGVLIGPRGVKRVRMRGRGGERPEII